MSRGNSQVHVVDENILKLLSRLLVVVFFASFFSILSATSTPSTASAQFANVAPNHDIVSVTTPDDSLRFHYPRRFAPAAQILQTQGPVLFHKLEKELGIEHFPTVDVWLLPELNLFFTLNELSGSAPPWAVGLSFSKKRTILVLHGIGPNREPVDTLKTFAHELAHVAIDEASGEYRVPRWFNEGFAVMQADEWGVERSEMLSRAAATGLLIPFESLTTSFPDHHNTVSVAYAQSFHFVRYLQGRFGADLFASLMKSVRNGENFYQALETETNMPFFEIEEQWRVQLVGGSSPWSILSDENMLFFGAALLFLVAWVVRRNQRRKRLLAMAEDEVPAAWDYDDSRYPLPGETHRS